jgi:hypothetical protein
MNELMKLNERVDKAVGHAERLRDLCVSTAVLDHEITEALSKAHKAISQITERLTALLAEAERTALAAA